MKKIIFMLFIFANQFANAQHQQLPDKQKIMHVLINQKEAWNRGDLVEYMQGYWQSDSLVFIGKSGINKGWNNTLYNYQQSYPTKEKMGKLSFDIISVEVLSKTWAHVTGKWVLTRSKKEILGGHFTLLFKKINNVWLIVSDHTS